VGEEIKLTVYNALGQQVKIVTEGVSLLSGTETIEVSTDGFENGVYYFKLSTNEKVVVRKMIRTK
jgi:hypothetical protein